MSDQPDAIGYAICLEARGFEAEAAELRRLRSANVKLAGALDMIRETLKGGNVDDLLYIINTALEEHRSKT